MVKAWLIGFMFYLLGVFSVRIRLQMEVQEDPDFITKFIERFGATREDSLAVGAPFIAAIFPGLNFLIGILLIVTMMNNKCWAMLKEEMLDKK